MESPVAVLVMVDPTAVPTWVQWNRWLLPISELLAWRITSIGSFGVFMTAAIGAPGGGTGLWGSIPGAPTAAATSFNAAALTPYNDAVAMAPAAYHGAAPTVLPGFI
jgi:hypothetical protein